MPPTTLVQQWTPSERRKILAAIQRPKPEPTLTTEIDPRHIFILKQARMTFDLIVELAESIARYDLKTPPEVALLTRRSFDLYLRVLNGIWGETYAVDQYSPIQFNGRPRYAILIAGERRLRACRYLIEIGCEKCRARRGHHPGACFTRHFPQNKIRVAVHENINPMAAISHQYHENLHAPVPVHEEAEGFYLLYRFQRQFMPDLTVAAFARHVGRSEAVIRRALVYADAGPDVQHAVRHGHVSYGIALELVRLQRGGFHHDEVLHQLRYFIVSGNGLRPVKQYRLVVTKMISERHSQQGQLFGLMTDEQERASRRLTFRRTLAEQFLSAMRGAVEYLQLVLRAVDDDEMVRVFAAGGVRSMLERIVDLLERINAHRRRWLPQKLQDRIRAATTEHHRLDEVEHHNSHPDRTSRHD